MKSSDRDHLEMIMGQFLQISLGGYTGPEGERMFSKAFYRKYSRQVSRGFDEMARLSPEMKEKMTFVRWDFVEKMRNSEDVYRELETGGMFAYAEIQGEVNRFMNHVNRMEW